MKNEDYFKKSSLKFPDPRGAEEDGLLAIGGKLDVPTLFTAYYHGIFPWPQEGLPILWFSPPLRGVLEFSDVHVNRSLQKEQRRQRFQFTKNQALRDVVEECAKAPRPGQSGTWILPAMKKAYVEFHEAGFAHSYEVWLDKKLVGGLYGVLIEGVFSGESMFFKESNASKLALLSAVEDLKQQGLTWMDTQMVTPILASFGGKEMPRDLFLKRLHESR